jgi:putative flippase GtrA
MRKLISIYLTRQFLLFLLAGGCAAIINFASRFLFEYRFDYFSSVALSYLIGMLTAFLLNQRYVFPRSHNPLKSELVWFIFFNLLALPVTICASLVLHEYVFSRWFSIATSKACAHAVGISLPVFVNFVAHKFVTFRS